ncbi:MAG: transcription termination/antitermination protein NusA [Actinobacteria bacterium ATB1]|nr:transcription termination/antitermination protein NusA [Actinobacteria bacterium ATB1]
MNSEIVEGLQMMARDKGLDYETLVEALEGALLAAYKRLPQAFEDSRVSFDEGDIRIYAQEVDDDGRVLREWDDTPEDFGRIAAQTAKQVLTQKLQAAERELKYEEYHGREGDIVTGIVQQKDARYTLLDLGKVEALMPQSEQVNYERVEQGARLKAYIVEVRKTAKGPQIVVSRTHPGLVLRLFELEVPEISDGVVEVRAIAREPGARTKIAVESTDPNVDPVGACVGARGSRVRMIVNELRGEKVDIVPFSDNIRDYIAKALSPAKVREVRIDEETHTAEVVVPDFQLSLAIGKEGQNARLAARLTGWRVDIRSDQPEPAEPEAIKEPQKSESAEVEAEVEATDIVADEAAEGTPEEAGSESGEEISGEVTEDASGESGEEGAEPHPGSDTAGEEPVVDEDEAGEKTSG